MYKGCSINFTSTVSNYCSGYKIQSMTTSPKPNIEPNGTSMNEGTYYIYYRHAMKLYICGGEIERPLMFSDANLWIYRERIVT